jgi:hypothetical protein
MSANSAPNGYFDKKNCFYRAPNIFVARHRNDKNSSSSKPGSGDKHPGEKDSAGR